MDANTRAQIIAESRGIEDNLGWLNPDGSACAQAVIVCNVMDLCGLLRTVVNSI